MSELYFLFIYLGNNEINGLNEKNFNCFIDNNFDQFYQLFTGNACIC
jgi:hypothetical protein